MYDFYHRDLIHFVEQTRHLKTISQDKTAKYDEIVHAIQCTGNGGQNVGKFGPELINGYAF